MSGKTISLDVCMGCDEPILPKQRGQRVASEVNSFPAPEAGDPNRQIARQGCYHEECFCQALRIPAEKGARGTLSPAELAALREPRPGESPMDAAERLVTRWQVEGGTRTLVEGIVRAIEAHANPPSAAPNSGFVHRSRPLDERAERVLEIVRSCAATARWPKRRSFDYLRNLDRGPGSDPHRTHDAEAWAEADRILGGK